MKEQQAETTLPSRFRKLVESHNIDDEDPIPEYETWADSVYGSAVATIASQAAANVPGELEYLLHHGDAPKGEHDLALVFALFIYARHSGEGARLKFGDTVFGDQPEQHLTEVTIEPNAKRGDFNIDVLVALREYGPHPRYREEDYDGPTDLVVVKEAALLRKRLRDERSYRDEALIRRSMTDLGLTSYVYDTDEIERDPFALARRVIDDLGRIARDEF